MKDNIKKAVELAEQEVQEKEIAKLKGIVKELLEKKARKEEDKREIEKEISVIKQTIDDFKAGRLDKVKELMDTDVIATRILPFTVVIINKPVLNQPWKWEYQVQTTSPQYTYASSGKTMYVTPTGYANATVATYTTTASPVCQANYSGTSATTGGWSGANYATFTTGTYDINGKIITL